MCGGNKAKIIAQESYAFALRAFTERDTFPT
jgi:hypothetical protein